MKKKELKYELMKSFHEQFAQNQNHHQNLFIQIVSILLTVIIGFGYTMYNFKTSGGENGIGILEFTSAFIISEIILVLGVSLVSNMALGFRRDQLMNTRIREFAKITEDTSNDDAKIFSTSYNPMKNYFVKTNGLTKKIHLDWMPNFHIIFSITLVLVQFILIVVYFIKITINNSNDKFNYFPLLSIIGLIIALFSFYIISKFHKKLLHFYLKNGMEELINNRYSYGKQ